MQQQRRVQHSLSGPRSPMPKIVPRAATPRTPRPASDLLRRSTLYGENIKAPYLHKKLCEEVVDSFLIRSSERGIPLASTVPVGQQMAERESGFVRRAKVSMQPERAFYAGTSTTVYSTEVIPVLIFCTHAGSIKHKTHRGNTLSNISRKTCSGLVARVRRNCSEGACVGN